MFERERIDRAAEHHEEERVKLYRPDGTSVYGEEEHAEREETLQREFRAALDAIGPDIERRIAASEQEVLKLEHSDPSSALTTEELEGANARRAFVADEVFGLSAEALMERMRAVMASGDRPAMFLYAHHARAKISDPVFGDDAQALELKELVGELDHALDPGRTRKTEAARSTLEEARNLKSYAHYRRNGARDAVELHMNRVYGRAVG